ncbi:hypothetical protein HDU79_011203, partial [Rhizoclosmatium sp. JEL0117]
LADPITDIEQLKKNLPPQTTFKEIAGYTHFEFLWATDASTKVFDPIIDLLQLHNQ